jgi:hypothetical protein
MRIISWIFNIMCWVFIFWEKTLHILHIPPCYRRARNHVYDFFLKPRLKLNFLQLPILMQEHKEILKPCLTHFSSLFAFSLHLKCSSDRGKKSIFSNDYNIDYQIVSSKFTMLTFFFFTCHIFIYQKLIEKQVVLIWSTIGNTFNKQRFSYKTFLNFLMPLWFPRVSDECNQIYESNEYLQSTKANWGSEW